MKHFLVLGIGFLSACSILNSSKTTSNQLLLTVGRDSVMVDEFIYAFEKNRPQDSIVLKSEVDDYLNLYTNFKLKVSEAKAKGMDTTLTFTKEYNSYVDQLNNSYLQSSNDTDSLVREAYDRLQFEISAAHILFTVDEAALPADTLATYNKAYAVRDSILNGASFEEMAATYSDDPSAKQNKGNLGYFTVFQMVYPFETAAYATAVNDVSLPTRTRFGYHLIKTLDKRPNEGKVKVAHIMIRQTSDAEERAFNLYNQLEAGADWNELCARYSEDGQSASRSGELVPFSRGQIVPAFANAAFGLTIPGEITEPIQTPYGWHIIKLIEKIPVNDFNELQQQLRSQVRRDSRSQISKNKMLERLAKENSLVEINENIQMVIDPENHVFGKTKWSFEGDSLSNLVLFTIKEQPYKAEGLYSFINKSPSHQKTKQFLFETYKSFKNESLTNFEKDHLGDKHPEYKFLRQEYFDGILLFSIMEEEVWEKASSDSLGLITFYEENKTDYIDSTTMEVIIFSSQNQSAIDSIATEITDYQDFLTIDSNEKELLRNENNESTQLSLQLESGEVKMETSSVLKSLTLPYQNEVLEVDDLWYYIIPVRTPDEPRRMEYIQGKLIADYQKLLEDKWLSQLNEKFPVVVNEKGLKETYSKLDTK